MLVACKDAAEVSCTISNILSELEIPCGLCDGPCVVLAGTSPLGEHIKIRLLPENVLEIDGAGEMLPEMQKRGCPCG
ncbi:MAG: hypothetical protein RR365_15170 [Bacteroides sp.]